jgi:hypothetical protein
MIVGLLFLACHLHTMWRTGRFGLVELVELVTLVERVSAFNQEERAGGSDLAAETTAEPPPSDNRGQAIVSRPRGCARCPGATLSAAQSRTRKPLGHMRRGAGR